MSDYAIVEENEENGDPVWYQPDEMNESKKEQNKTPRLCSSNSQ